MKKNKLLTPSPTRVWLALIGAVGVASMATTAWAVTPVAGTRIGNIASATYTDEDGTSRNIESNLVETVVNHVPGVDLTDPRVRYTTSPSVVFFAHTVENTGNGTDTYSLSAVNQGGDDFQFANLVIYPDDDENGIPDNFTPITATPTSLAPGETFSFVVAATVPPGQAVGDDALVLVTATGAFDPPGAGTPSTDSNTDQAIITAGPVFTVQKSIDQNSGTPTSAITGITLRLTYTNTGASVGTLILTDTIDSDWTYTSGSAVWSANNTTLTDAADAVEATLTQTSPLNNTSINYSVAGNVITVTLAGVDPQESGYVEFDVSVAALTPPQIIPNTANYQFDADFDGDIDGSDALFPTNTVNFEVLPIAAVDIEGDDVASADQGSVVTFFNTVVNNGTGADTFDITFGPSFEAAPAGAAPRNAIEPTSAFPAGTTFQLYNSPDGVAVGSPLTDTDGDGTPDTGTMAAGSTRYIVLRAFLPPNGGDGAAPNTTIFGVRKVATSNVTPSVFDVDNDTLQEILEAAVDLTNNGTVLGDGAGPEGSPVTTLSGNPGATVRFQLNVNNEGPANDVYDLVADGDGNFATIAMPAGWTVVFRTGGTLATPGVGTVVTGTTTVAPATGQIIFADVTIPANATPQTQAVYFRALSPNSTAADVKYDAVTVNTVRDISLVQDQTSQVFPGGRVTYSHLLTNNGNVTEGSGPGANLSEIVFTLADTDAAQGWLSVIYWDQDNDGELDANEQDAPTDVVNDFGDISGTGLAPAASVRLFVVVFAPLGVDNGAQNVTTITATTSGLINTVAAPAVVANDDTTHVVTGDLQLIKSQALDADNDGLPDGGAGAYTTADLTADPGTRILYRVIAVNSGSQPITNVVINDTTPQYTFYSAFDPAATLATSTDSRAKVVLPGGSVIAPTSGPANGAAGQFVFTIGTLNGSQQAVIYFGVVIDNTP